MAGRGRAPKDPVARINNHAPIRGEVQAAPAVGWQHGEIPPEPEGMMPESVKAWNTWFTAWYAAFWTPSDLPGLRQLVRLYDQVERGEFQRAGELRLQMDTYGITPKGQQDRRWTPPKKSAPPAAAPTSGAPKEKGRYGHLKTVV